MKEEYLGDGLYVSYDGGQFCLRAPDRDDGDHIVYLDESVLALFINYVKRIQENLNEQRNALKFK